MRQQRVLLALDVATVLAAEPRVGPGPVPVSATPDDAKVANEMPLLHVASMRFMHDRPIATRRKVPLKAWLPVGPRPEAPT